MLLVCLALRPRKRCDLLTHEKIIIMKLLKNLFKPDRRVMAVFIVLSILIFLDLYMFGQRAIPCLTKPVVSPEYNPPWVENLCSLRPGLIGVSVQFTWASHFSVLFLVLVLPYFLACVLSKLVFRKRSLFSKLFRNLKLKK